VSKSGGGRDESEVSASRQHEKTRPLAKAAKRSVVRQRRQTGRRGRAKEKECAIKIECQLERDSFGKDQSTSV